MNYESVFWGPPADSTMAGTVDFLYDLITWVSIFFFVLICALILFACIRYRQKGWKVSKTTSGMCHNLPLETAWTVIPTIIMMVFFYMGFKDYLRLYMVPDNPVEINVMAQQWSWAFTHSSGVEDNVLVVPEGRPVKLIIQTKRVLHSLFIPDFRVKADAMPNRYTTLWFEATETGEHDLFCTEFCGDQHSAMYARVKVVTQAEYEKYNVYDDDMKLWERGKKLFEINCAICHKLEVMDDPSCPHLPAKFGTTTTLVDDTQVLFDEEYARRSMVFPQKQIVKGFEGKSPMVSFKDMSDQKIIALIAYLRYLTYGEEKTEAGDDEEGVSEPATPATEESKDTPDEHNP